ncbi:uncharacterized protein EDB93DRAFT_1255923 [Suillus bovinus]|uniref:uncharacterized protein n=1 Tax=Suillus bovinus TaxID=48563 RepID=UPI001B86482D|nr:uncharacterized protein EDB93DRAFT_1255923 [Suillus bovinus]KAG2130310.1 hypothetical protein EDB93DRAFT_1255923 [Suillus bovinus]
MSPTTMFSPGPTLRGHHFTGALESELQGAQTMHSRFPEPLKAAFLKAMPRIKSHLDQCHLRLTELLTMTQFKFTRLVQILEEQHEKSHEKGMAALKDKVKWSGSFMDVQCSIMSCDHLAFSKSIIRRFIRDCVDRDAAVASPWTVKPVIAKHYGVDSVMPEETRKDMGGQGRTTNQEAEEDDCCSGGKR